MSIITITRGQYSGGEEIAEIVAKALGARCVSDEVLREAASSYQVDEKKMARFFDSDPTLWERLTKSRNVHAAYIKASLVNWCQDDNLVYHGNAGQELLREIPHVLKVRIMHSFDLRVKRIMEQFGHKRPQAENLVRQIDEDRTKRMLYYYNADWRDATRYDVMIRLDNLTPEFVAQTILEMSRQPGFQLSKADVPRLRDVHLQSSLYALGATLLGSRMDNMVITVRDGLVTMEGSFPSRDMLTLDQLIKEVQSVEGVKEVKNQITAGMIALNLSKSSD